jgi:exopolysaccharide biosynthesis protein
MYSQGSGSNSPFNFFAAFKGLVFLLCVLCASVVDLFPQDFKQVHPGVEYAQVDHKIGDDPVKINLLRLDLTKVRLDLKLAMDTVVGTESTSSIATRHSAVAAINAGFFRLDNSIFAGTPAGIMMGDRFLLREPSNNRIAMVIANNESNTVVYFDRFTLGHTLRVGNRRISINGINRERKENEVIIYTAHFANTTLTESNGLEILVSNNRVVKIFERSGSNVIPADGFVISISEKDAEAILRRTRVGTRAELLTKPVRERDSRLSPTLILETHSLGRLYSMAEDIVAGVPQLIKNGKIDITWEKEKAGKAFVFNRHPRTAVAKLKDGKFLMIAVDGRQPGVSVGMNLQELAEYLLSLGAVDAMNLDGGGSTTMFLDGKVVNQPSDPNGERKVGDALIVTLRKK